MALIFRYLPPWRYMVIKCVTI